MADNETEEKVKPEEEKNIDDNDKAEPNEAGEDDDTKKPSEEAESNQVDQKLIEKIQNFKKLNQNGIYFNENLVKNKSYRNPNVYKNLVKYFELDEFKSNFEFKVFNTKNDNGKMIDFEFLREEQQKLEDLKQQQQNQKDRTNIDFVNSSNSTNINKRSSNYHHHHQYDNSKDHKRRK